MDEQAQALREQVTQLQYRAQFEQIAELCTPKLDDPNPDVAVMARLSLSRAALSSGKQDEARQQTDAALERARRGASAAVLAEALCDRVSLCTADLRLEPETSDFAREALQLAQNSGDLRLIAWAEIVNGYVQFIRASYPAAQKLMKTAVQHAHQVSDREVEAHALNGMALVLRSRRDHALAAKAGRQALALYQQIGDTLDQVITLSNLSHYLFASWRAYRAFDEAEAHVIRALTLAREIGYRYGEVVALGSLGDLYLTAGLNIAAIEYLEQSLALARSFGIRRFERQALMELSLAHFRNKTYDDALAAARDQLDLTQVGDFPQWESGGYYTIGNAYLKQKQHRLVLPFWRRGLAADRRNGLRARYRQSLMITLLFTPYLGVRSWFGRQPDPHIDVTSLLELRQD